MPSDQLIIQGACTHNLKDISLAIPKRQVVVFTGVSGAGKSSLVFDTIYTEAQRQLVETFSAFARRFLPKLTRPPVEEIRNISTAIIIDQKRMGRTLRSTVGTATEIFTHLRMLYSRCAQPFIGWSNFFSFNHPEGMCPACKGLGKRISVDTPRLLDLDKSLRAGAITHPDFKVDGWSWRELVACGLFDADRPLREFAPEELEKLLHAEGIPINRAHGAGIYSKQFEGVARRLERRYVSKAEDETPEADKDVYDRYFVYRDCADCGGTRLNPRARSARLAGRTIDQLAALELGELDAVLAGVEGDLARPMVARMRQCLATLIRIGVGYLSLSRSVATLSGGESQRVKMARQLNCDLVDMMYILDEPSIGLHPRDHAQLAAVLRQLRDQGNSVLVVEHDPEIIRAADWVVEIGPCAGRDGGRVLYNGPAAGLEQSDTATGACLRARAPATGPRKPWHAAYAIRGATLHNLKAVDVDLPRGVFTCVTGVAGSGKSSLIHGVFVPQHPEAVVVDQTAIGRSSRSIPATFLGIFDAMRKEIARATGADPALFSFNSRGACPKCKGQGALSLDMGFLDDVAMTCDECQGRKYKDEVLQLRYQGRAMDEVLDLTAAEARTFFEAPEIRRRLAVLCDVGLDYLEIGQPLSSLSGGEAQRLKLASELHKHGQVYVLDEPTTGLHMADCEKLLHIIRRLRDHDNSVLVIEHNLDIIKHADWVIDMGPGGGRDGGAVVAVGTPEQVAACPASHTGRYLKDMLGAS